MKYVLTWRERPAGSAAEYEATQKRILDVFSQWEMPKSLTFHQFVVRVGEFGGYAVIETDEPADLQYLTTIYAAFTCTVEPVLDVMDAVAAENRGVEWRDALADA
ncbi:DUF3303 domain-containing protein [Geodermatophilus marinus]|uniref:DUF3303 domain-containing protein n=1 Tax=Geodermatophilus sp. LHW52908 TaxID=2303986 RepID=UPI000E3EAB91|nr:DUF3303 family protein [Geodermatophilus sp. LHW52908]RFU21136.1 DUF3303 domain-containing protein [Geodermatophilus sp. LHW52908]